MRRLLTDPDRFFAKRRRDPRLRRAVGAVLCVGLLASVLAATLLPALPLPVSGAPTPVLAAAVGVGTVLVAWVVNAAVLHALSAPLATAGEFRTTLTLTGWGFVPSGGSFAAATAAVAATSDLGNQLVDAGFGDVVALPSVRVAAGLVVVFSVWHAFLMFFAVEYGRGLTGRWAAVVTAAPFVAAAVAVAVLV